METTGIKRVTRVQSELLQGILTNIEQLESYGYTVRIVFSGDGVKTRMGQITYYWGEEELYGESFYAISFLTDIVEKAIKGLISPFEPNWEEAPSWANYWSKDEGGGIYWCSVEPELDRIEWVADNIADGRWREDEFDDYSKIDRVKLDKLDWRESLRKRP